MRSIDGFDEEVFNNGIIRVRLLGPFMCINSDTPMAAKFGFLTYPSECFISEHGITRIDIGWDDIVNEMRRTSERMKHENIA